MNRQSLQRALLRAHVMVVVTACTILAAATVLFSAFLLRRDQDMTLRLLAQARCQLIEEEQGEGDSVDEAVAEAFSALDAPGYSFEYIAAGSPPAAGEGAATDDRCVTTTARAAIEGARLRACSSRCAGGGIVRATAASALDSKAARVGLAAMALALPVAAVVGGLLGGAVLRRRLAPLAALRDAVERREPGSETRLNVGAEAEELAALESAVDDLLERLAEALARERRFARDASHELRTPLTVLQGRLESLHARGATPEIEAALAGARHLARLVDALLLLARSDEAPMPTTPVNLCDIARDVAARHATSAAIEVDAPDEVLVRGSEELLARAIENLVENARKHAGQAARVRLTISAGAGHANVTVEDDGGGVPDDERAGIFERFVRGARQGDVPGVGLGLAVVRSIVERHGGAATAGVSPLGGLLVRLEIPVLT